MIENYSLFQIVIILVTYLFASSVKGVTGLGFSTVCLPFLALTVGLKAALPLLIIPSLLSNIIIMRQVGNFQTTLLQIPTNATSYFNRCYFWIDCTLRN